MLGFLSITKDTKAEVKKDQIYFVSVPDLPPSEIKERFSQLAQSFANKMDTDKVYLNYGKDDSIEYDYSI